ncbi:MAG: glycosyltransferase [Candidatus Nomurabacteria bacterium]|jgi:glycosyltransferase involved in cell wall biosynthesis|nr:glycosyltransferase [Candidatus Nomurabacteria bacterium]
MKIGLFTDTYHPSTNGVVYVVDSTRKWLEKMGHEVYIYCPAESFLRSPKSLRQARLDSHVIRIPSVRSVGPDAPRTSLFMPPAILRKIKKQNLDIIHFFTPSVVGMVAVYAAKKTGAKLVAQHCTDIYQYLDYYPIMKPAVVFASFLIPMAAQMNRRQLKQLAKLYIPKRRPPEIWSKRMISLLMSIAYSSCDAVIAVSRKSQNQLRGFTRGAKINFKMIPTGVDPIAVPSDRKVAAFRHKHGIADDEQVVLYVGRLGTEKNIDMLIPTYERVLAKKPKTKFLFVGDNEYRAEFEAKIAKSKVAERAIFTGHLPHGKLGVAYAAGDVFVFPSITDTQGLVLHEAALAGLPIVLIDGDVTEVVKFNYNGYIVRNSPADFAWRVLKILIYKSMQKRFSENSVKLASEFSEQKQVSKLVELYTEILKK